MVNRKNVIFLSIFILTSCLENYSINDQYTDHYLNAFSSGNFISPIYKSEDVGHLQGIVQHNSCMLMVFTHLIIRVNSSQLVECNLLEKDYHLGSPTMYNGYLFVPVEKGGFNGFKQSNSFVYKIDPTEFSVIDEIKINEIEFGLGGIAFGDNKFLLVGGNPSGSQINFIYEYDTCMNFIQKYKIYSGKIEYGFQTITFNKDLFYWELLGYNSQQNNNSLYSSFVLDRNLQLLGSLYGIDLNPSNFGFSHDIDNLHFIGLNYSENNIVYGIVYKNQPQILNQFSLYRLNKLGYNPIYFSKNQILELNKQIHNKFTIGVNVKLRLNTGNKIDCNYFLLGGHNNIYSSNSLHAAFIFMTTDIDGKGKFKFILKNETNEQAILFSETEVTIDHSEKVYHLIATYDGSLIKFWIDDILQDQLNMNGSLQDFSEFTIGSLQIPPDELESELYNINILNDVLIK